MQNPLLFVLLYIGSIECANILALVPVNSRSHFIVMEPLFKALASRGHQITVVSPFPQKKPLPNYTDIDISKWFPSKGKSFSIDFIKSNAGLQGLLCFKAIAGIGDVTCDVIYSDQRVSKLYNSTGKFDLVITEIFSSDCFVLFAEKFDVPLISFVTSVSLPWSNDRIGNPDNPSYIVNYINDFAHQMSFYERAINTATLIYIKMINYYHADLAHRKTVNKFFGDEAPEFHEVYNRRTALIFVNSHYTVNQPRPMVPNFVEVGGIHLQQSEPLPKDLQDMLDKAKDGFILFSMGTLVNCTTFSDHVLSSFMNTFITFGNLLVLWKYDGKLPNQPKNVITRKWMPQKDILVHKNVKMFITHGGLSSTLEAVNAGVPVLGIPMFGDQPANIMNLVRRGAGISIDYDDITTEKLTSSIREIIEDKSYKENAVKLSTLFKDRPQSALDSAIFWTEHVLRHKGALHMRSAAADMPLYKLLLLDVTLIFLAIIIVICAGFYKITNYFLGLATSTKLREKSTTKIRAKRD
ncbi:UDP-glucosyltransferase 2 [Nilaparvata lugens]|uniref:UDP-glucosyltransferase 2 n=1 Tax=Nilaparvata lugens TaxID=108931 RepID=UPI00193D06AE|nr:UDP-glucosyltransferase 2 [Nilaparvata lugens]XP_022207635.2 UDP-glucosyltransferase 2 [Nilaparvata lugens]XP_039276885.1 UDP-glucosyltransferase 2 [Nilaparvata lugens]XP_039276886.1 UDP-glucosyltransferase 2 [Nilaparvata lugens]